MDARQFNKCVVAMFFGLMTGEKVTAKTFDPHLRTIHKKTASGKWKRVRMKEIKKGDIFTIDSRTHICTAVKDAYQNKDGVWQVNCSMSHK